MNHNFQPLIIWVPISGWSVLHKKGYDVNKYYGPGVIKCVHPTSNVTMMSVEVPKGNKVYYLRQTIKQLNLSQNKLINNVSICIGAVDSNNICKMKVYDISKNKVINRVIKI